MHMLIRGKGITSLFFLCVSILSSFACNPSSRNEPGTKSFTAKIDSLFHTELEEGRFSGTIVIGHKEEVFYNKAFGIADRTSDTRMQPDFRFDIASLNKSMVGALIMIAVQEGRLSLNDKLVDQLSDYSYTGSFNENITIHQMLTHTSGLPDYDGVSQELAENNFSAFKREHFTNQRYVDFISKIDRVSEPGKQFNYSNFAYHLLCIILENMYEKSFGELLEENILQPLDMKFTFSTTDNDEVFEEFATGYVFSDGIWKENPFIDLTIGRRVFSTSGDLFKWASALNKPGLLSQESLDLIKVNHLKSITKELSYGYGWVVFDDNDTFRMGDLSIDRPYIIHGGSTDGFKSLLINIENGKWVIAILANSGNRTNELDLGKRITELLINNYK